METVLIHTTTSTTSTTRTTSSRLIIVYDMSGETARRDYKRPDEWGLEDRDLEIWICEYGPADRRRSRIRFCNVDGNLASTHARQPQVTDLFGSRTAT
ncbi:GD16268 [Drosophila simulans]|uniref:GD16268 n=1 Tax=Drosophila simulans TaxID=7240 RepID=B4R4R9_DROSI|nr:GD16268 [Drosophila simulans]